MSSLDPLLAILQNPGARVVFVLDTTGSAVGSGLHEQAFDYLRMLRQKADPEGVRTVAITDRFAVRYPSAKPVEPHILPISARSVEDIPRDQVNAGGDTQPFECLPATALFHSYAPTHLVFISDLMIQLPDPAKFPCAPENALFLMWDATPQRVEEMRGHFAGVGRVLPLFLPGEQQYLHACEEAEALSDRTPSTQATAKSRPRL